MRLSAIFLSLTLLAGCVQNPVTGERHLQFYGTDWEKEVGSNLYEPMRQVQGGKLVVDPELNDYVQQVGQRLASRARRADELDFEFQVLNNSTPNAWALPGGKIAINRGLLMELESEAELAAVLGHEVVHADAAHSARQQSKGLLTQIGAIAGMILIDSKVDSTAGKQLAAMVPALGAQLLAQRYSRDAEREADHYGMRYMSEAGYDPQGAVELQKTFVRLSEGRASDWLSGLFASHPPSQERVESNIETAANLPEGGETGVERYERKLTYMKRVKPAYDAYDEAMKAASEENYAAAREHLEKALSIEPRESLFHVMDGDLKAEAGEKEAALRAYDQAVAAYDDFFYHHLQRGRLYYELGRPGPARGDLEQSLELVPTGPAHYLLGELDRQAGNLESARYHYGQAAQTDTGAGRKAERQLVMMEIGSNPGKYVQTAGAADDGGRIYCVVANQTRVPIADVVVAARFMDDGGTVRETRRRRREVLAGGEQAGIPMGWRTANTDTIQQRIRCVVQNARVAPGASG